jgi:hypothetical protein
MQAATATAVRCPDAAHPERPITKPVFLRFAVGIGLETRKRFRVI